MYMSYTKNPHMPKVRQAAAELVRRGFGVRTVARKYGVSPGTITKWVKKAEKIGYHPIPTLSSKPRYHPHQLKEETVRNIVEKRLITKRCSEVVHRELQNEGLIVSLSSVKRTLERNFLIKKRSPWKRYHPHVDRPEVLNPGDLVELDTIHLMLDRKTRIYVYTLIDVHSRWVYARAYRGVSSATSIEFIRKAERISLFKFNMLQTDHGPEFGKWFVSQIQKSHRYTRIGKPNDNSHIERFNRTLQEECLDKVKVDVRVINIELEKYLKYYNEKRLHLGLDLQTPLSRINSKCFQAIG